MEIVRDVKSVFERLGLGEFGTRTRGSGLGLGLGLGLEGSDSDSRVEDSNTSLKLWYL